jgi:hypothetical protein
LELQAIASFPQHGLPFPAPQQDFPSLAAEVVACFPLPQSVTAFSVLAVCVAASHVSDIFAVAAGLRLVIRRGLIAMVFFDGRNRRQRDLRRHRFRERSLPPVLVICAAACDAGLG